MILDHDNGYMYLLGRVIKAVEKNGYSYSYIVELDTYKTMFMSDILAYDFPAAELEGICYEQFRGRSEPCENCPLKNLDEGMDYLDGEMDYRDLGFLAMVSLSRLNIDDRKGAFFHVFGFKPTDVPVGVDSFTSDVMLHNALSKSTDDFIYMCDIKKNLWLFPKTMVEEFNLPGEVFYDAGSFWAALVHENDRAMLMADLDKVFSGETDFHNMEYRVQNKDGQWVWVRCRGKMEYDEKGDPILFAGVITNLGQKNKIDYISGLLNKYEFEKIIDDELNDEDTKDLAILLLGIDNFKHVNNLYGWEFGDAIIRATANKVQSVLPLNMELFRLNGDVFGVYMKNANGEDVSRIYDTIKYTFNEQQEFKGNRYFCTFSGGCVITNNDRISVYALLKRAEYALDCAKADGKNKLNFYNPEGLSGKERNLKIIQSLRDSVYNGFKDFEVYYQPQVDAITQKVGSAEALLRWNCGTYGRVGPDEFVPLLEESGLIHDVGKWVLEESVKTCKEWRNKKPDFVVSVNLSYLQLLDKEFIDFVAKLLEFVELPSEALHLEITESCIASGSSSLSNAFDEIRNHGITIEMDDFGTGYSSLEILKNKPADVVKIDRAFVKDITNSDFDATFISFVVALCHSVGIKVCLEGVETWEEYELVKSMELDIIQGYLFGRPVDKGTFEINFLDKD